MGLSVDGVDLCRSISAQMPHEPGRGGGEGGGEGGDFSMKCVDVYIWGLKMYPCITKDALGQKHTNIEGIRSALTTHTMVYY